MALFFQVVILTKALFCFVYVARTKGSYKRISALECNSPVR